MLILLLACVSSPPVPGCPTTVSDGERVVLFPTTAAPRSEGGWTVPVRGQVFEPESDSLKRRVLLEALQQALGLDELESTATFTRVAAALLVDHERDESVQVQLGETSALLGPTDTYGWFEAELQLPPEAPQEQPWFGVQVPRCGEGTALAETQAWRQDGPSIAVVSDIDDTVKVSQVTDLKALLRHTFLEPFQAAPGMAELYRGWAEQGAAFHFVSSSPWQLFGPLQSFLRASGFPEASFHLKRLRLTDSSLLDLWADPMETKPPAIRALLQAAPDQAFVLVGDSGEHDPEVYGTIAREHPGRIAGVFIRDVTGQTAEDPRYQAAFADLDPALWRVFTDPSTLPPLPVGL